MLYNKSEEKNSHEIYVMIWVKALKKLKIVLINSVMIWYHKSRVTNSIFNLLWTWNSKGSQMISNYSIENPFE